jgi:DNA (cytosine-5)-methyltransferase 1
MLRAIREIQPTWVVGENVRGLTNWNGGMVFDEVQADLENEGYEVTPFLLPACAVNAPHRRDRIWFVAYSNSCANRRNARENEGKSREERLSEWNKIRESSFSSEIFGVIPNANSSTKESSGKSGEIEINRSNNYDESSSRREQAEQYSGCSDVLRNVADTERIGQSGSWRTKEQMRTKTDREWKASWAYDDGRWPTQSPICNGNDGISDELDGITVSKWKQESIKAGGNAIVPQVAFQIFKAIALHDVSLSEA